MFKIAFLSLMLFFGITQVSHSEIVLDNPETTRALLDKEINKRIFYPVMEQLKHNAEVLVTIQINGRGEVEVISSKGTDADIIHFVEQQLQRIKLPEDQIVPGEIFRYRFAFKRQA